MAEPASRSIQAPARKTPNRTMTVADWAEGMRLFCVEGWSDADIAIRFDISTNTVARYRFNHGIKRADYPVARRGRPAPPPRPDPVDDDDDAPNPTLIAREGDDSIAIARALLEQGRAQAAAGRLDDAVASLRMAGSFRRAARLEADLEFEARYGVGDFLDAGGDGIDPEPPPELRPAQLPPEAGPEGEPWSTWLFLGGRGAGKTLAGAAWLAGRARVRGRLALVGPAYADAREVMIEGPSGLRGLAARFGPLDSQGRAVRPRYEPSRRRLLWPNGAVAQVFSAEDVDGMRGPQFEAAWGDELCAWPDAAGALAVLRMGLRLGADPRLVLTTTPRPTAALRALLAEPGLVLTRGSALDNAAHLAPGFVAGLRGLYGGTRLERQEIDGEVLEALEGAVFRRPDVERARALGRDGPPAHFSRLVVAVDPPAGVGVGGGSACGIVVAGILDAGHAEPRCWVLADHTCHGLTVAGWAGRVIAAAKWAAGLGFTVIVAEANQGGEMVRQVLREAEAWPPSAGARARPSLPAPIRLAHARVGKVARAEPVALLYEQGRVAHAPGLAALEDQMLLLGAEGRGGNGGRAESRLEARPEGSPAGSPDRADALVWALTTLAISPASEPAVTAI